jgi:hypothetical protein
VPVADERHGGRDDVTDGGRARRAHLEAQVQAVGYADLHDEPEPADDGELQDLVNEHREALVNATDVFHQVNGPLVHRQSPCGTFVEVTQRTRVTPDGRENGYQIVREAR